MTKEELKARVIRAVDDYREELIELSQKIHDNPELGFQEKKAAVWLTDFLAKKGFSFERGIGGLPTAFKAVYGNSSPLVALFAEYDALPVVGHGCGHNLIAAAAVGAGIAGKIAVDNCGGTVAVFGTPAEEILGGKVALLEAGVFDGVDIAMIAHPGVRNIVTAEWLACIGLEIEFFGKAAHAAAHPEQGINALEAMILAFNSVNSLRQHIKDRARIHGVITCGGEAANVVPSYSAARFLVRASDSSYLDEIEQKVINCFIGAAIATGARLEHRRGGESYAPMKNNLFLAQLFSRNLESLGRVIESFHPQFGVGSTDMGNVSQIVPAIHPSVAIAPPDTLLHSADFALAAASEAAHNGLLDMARALAMTIVDLLYDPLALARVKEEFISSM